MQPIPLIQITGGGTRGKRRYKLNEQGLKQCLLSKKVRDLPIAVISVTGKMRKGKSFILNLILEHAMKTSVEASEGKPDGEETFMFDVGDLGGRDAHGIYIWPQIFIRRTGTGQKFGLLLVDTQGTMSSHTPMSEWADIFTISTLFCSTQIYNVSVTIGEQQLHNLELFAEYARFVAQTSLTYEQPFERLLILVRDFKYGETYGYGMDAGKEFFESFVMRSKQTYYVFKTNSIPEDNKAVRDNILNCFETTDCCCLPHPDIRGDKEGPEDEDNSLMRGMDSRFQEHVRGFISDLLAPEHTVLKKINGQKVTLAKLYENLKKWVALLNKQDLPSPKTLYRGTALRHHRHAVLKAVKNYEMKMKEAGCSGTDTYVEADALARAHDLAMEEAVNTFHNITKFGNGDPSMDWFKLHLKGIINERFDELVAQNHSKNGVLQLQNTAFLTAVYLVCLAFDWSINVKQIDFLEPYKVRVHATLEGLSALIPLELYDVAVVYLWSWWHSVVEWWNSSSVRRWLRYFF